MNEKPERHIMFEYKIYIAPEIVYYLADSNTYHKFPLDISFENLATFFEERMWEVQPYENLE